MKWYWVIPICFAIIGYFGIFWSLSLSNIEVSFEMDNNTLQAIESIEWEYLSPNCVDADYWYNKGYGRSFGDTNLTILNETLNCFEDSIPEKLVEVEE